MKYFNIAVDGPAGSGKSSVSKEFARRNPDFVYINTGAMFRTYALYLLNKGVDVKDEISIQQELPNINVKLVGEEVYMVTAAGEQDVTDTIKTPDVAKAASAIANLACVRSKLLLDQRAIADNNNVIMDGRDIGTVVLPNAQLKIYLLASSRERALRRLKELEILKPNQTFSLDIIEKEINERDYQDMHREIAPLKKADDAIELDTNGMTVSTCCDAIEQLYQGVISKK